MKRSILMALFGCLFLLNSYGENKDTDVVDSRTYQGVAKGETTGRGRFTSGPPKINCWSYILPIGHPLPKMAAPLHLIA